jgi:ribonucleotide monophosphatase NagD (HAD superfamily)
MFNENVKQLGMEELHKEHPEQILFVGDQTQQDIVGGNKMGWQTCLMTTTEVTSHGLATFEGLKRKKRRKKGLLSCKNSGKLGSVGKPSDLA